MSVTNLVVTATPRYLFNRLGTGTPTTGLTYVTWGDAGGLTYTPPLGVSTAVQVDVLLNAHLPFGEVDGTARIYFEWSYDQVAWFPETVLSSSPTIEDPFAAIYRSYRFIAETGTDVRAFSLKPVGLYLRVGCELTVGDTLSGASISLSTILRG